MASLANTRAKLEWADHHLEVFQYAWGLYRNDDPYKFTAKRNKDRWVILRIHIIKPPPPELGLIFGDCLYSLRSALDNRGCPARRGTSDGDRSVNYLTPV